MWHKDDAGMDTLDAEQTWTQSRPGRRADLVAQWLGNRADPNVRQSRK